MIEDDSKHILRKHCLLGCLRFSFFQFGFLGILARIGLGKKKKNNPSFDLFSFQDDCYCPIMRSHVFFFFFLIKLSGILYSNLGLHEYDKIFQFSLSCSNVMVVNLTAGVMMCCESIVSRNKQDRAVIAAMLH